MPYPELIFRDFSPGMSTVEDEGDLPDGAGRRVLNLRIDEEGVLRHIGGLSDLIPDRANPVNPFRRYTDPTDTTVKRLILAEKTGSNPSTYTFYARDEVAATEVGIGAATSYTDPVIVQAGRDLYITQSNGALLRWSGPGATTLRTAGHAAYRGVPTVAVGGAGNLNVTNRAPYNYYYTNVSDLGEESNPSPISADVLPIAQSVDVTIPVTAVSNTASHNVYRIGGANRTIRLVGNTAYTGAPIVFNDNIADEDLSLVQLSFNHHTAPGGFRALALHNNRLWGAGLVGSLVGSPSRLWISSLGQFGYWPPIPTDSINDGGYLVLDDNPEDHIIGLSSLGSLLAVHRRQSVFFVYGQDWTNFRGARRSENGTVSRKSIVRYQAANFRLCADKRVRVIYEGDDVWISKQIQPTLDAVPDSLLENASACIYKDQYILSIPNPGGTPYVFIYNIPAKNWVEGGDALDALFHATHLDSSIPPNGFVPELLFSVPSGYTKDGGGAYDGIRRGQTSDLVERQLEWRSDWIDFGQPGFLSRVESVRLEGDLTIGAVAPTVQVSSKNKLGTVTNNLSIGTGSGVVFDQTWPLTQVGHSHEITIKGKFTRGHIRRIAIAYSILGQEP